MIDRPAQLVHATGNVELRVAAVHVPAGIVNGHEATAGLAKPAGQEQLMSKAGGTVAANAGLEPTGVVTIDESAILAGQIECLPGPAEDQVIGLPLKAVERGHCS